MSRGVGGVSSELPLVTLKIAILFSGRHGRGSNMQCIADACTSGQIRGRIVRVIGNYSDSPAVARASAQGLSVKVIPSPRADADLLGIAKYEERLLDALAAANPDLICLAGYLRKLPSAIVRQWSGKIMNTHPALLPSFGGKGMYGINVHQAVLDYGVKVTGCTVHFVNDAYDAGPIILQRAVPVLETDTAQSLAARVLHAEHIAYPEAAALFADNRLSLVDRRVTIFPEGETAA